MRIATLFSGIGAPEQGAARVYPNHEIVFACEFDKFARQSYEANYDIEPEHFHKDVNDLDATQYKGKVDILIGGSPCQAFSIAGLRHGTDDERGQLIYQYIRVVEECMPEVIVYENVKGMMSIGGGRTIKEFVQALRGIGYHCHYDVVNTKDYGVPQNRERIFLVGFLNADDYMRFEFAPKQPLEKRLKDVLQDDVDEKYYLNRELNMTYESQANTIHDTDKASPTLCAFTHGYAGGYINEPYMMQYPRGENKGGAVAKDGIYPTITINSWEHNCTLIEPKIQVPSATKSGYETATAGDSINLSVPNSKTRRGRVGKQVAQTLDTACNQAVVEKKIEQWYKDEHKQIEDGDVIQTGQTNMKGQRIYKDGVAPTLPAENPRVCSVLPSHRIRKLTPRECLRLQDFPDTFEIVVSGSQAYKQAGNSMSVNILEMIFNQIEKAKSNEKTNTLMDFIGETA